MRVMECTAAWSADAVITHSAEEAALLRDAVPGASVHVVPWAVPVSPAGRRAAPFRRPGGVAFIGHGAHAPNADAASWLVEEVMPLVWQADPAIGCVLVGSALPERVRTLAGPGVTVLGHVPDLRTVFDRVRLTVAPLRFGAGIKGKVLTSLAARTPCVMTPVAAEGLDLPPVLRDLVAQDAAGLASLIVRLHGDEARVRAAARAGAAFDAPHVQRGRCHRGHGRRCRQPGEAIHAPGGMTPPDASGPVTSDGHPVHPPRLGGEAGLTTPGLLQPARRSAAARSDHRSGREARPRSLDPAQTQPVRHKAFLNYWA